MKSTLTIVTGEKGITDMGKIILLNTPIGNVSDVSARVREALTEGNVFAVEDTRSFKELLNHLGISLEGKNIFAFHDQSDDSQLSYMIEKNKGQTLYVASEAGSPIVSDPAYPLIKAALAAGYELDTYSGISSVIVALELAGLPPIPFAFHGFLQRDNGKKREAFLNLGYGTHFFFEAPTRIEDTLKLLAETHPEMDVAVMRELTKKFQTVHRFKAKDWKEQNIMSKGEFVLGLYQPEAFKGSLHKQKELALEVLASGGSPKTLAKLLGEILERNNKEIYSELEQKKARF